MDLPDENSTSAAHDIDHDSLSPQNSNVILLPSADGVAKQHATHSVGRDWNMSSNNNTNDNYDDDDIYSNSYDTSSTTVIVRRRFGSGLGNLGNTCFMNSTLQCLAHTQSLQRYFLTGAYIQDLNRDNPLGTGGELATQFAHLLAEMWCSKQQVVNQHGSGNASTTELYTSSTNVVYPKNFKHTLGKHAEQFIGYDQHDSQELATYLLDALHEDCNRVTNKPYIEKPEQTENESDQDASDKAWELHLKREDSRVLENFMGQVKSHVKCCKPECGRVSTTFDPFMFLSVPIPGSEDRSLRFTFVPLNPSVRPMKLSVNVGKAASVEEILKSIIDLLPSTACLPDPSAVPNWTDLIICDLWKKEIFEWINPDGDGEKIRDNDDTFVYQVRPLADIQTLGEKPSDFPIGDAEIAKLLNISDTKRSRHYQLDIAILTRINRGDEWLNEMQKYMRTPTMLMHAFNIRKGTSEDRTRIYHSLTQFLKQCNLAIESDEDPTSQKRNRSDTIDDATNGGSSSGSGSLYLDTVSSVDVKESDQRCDIPSSFDGVKNKHDLAILEFLAGKMFQEIIRLERRKEEIDPNGVVIEVRIRTGNLLAANPFVVRVPCDMTVFGFRLELALRLARCLKTNAAQYGNRLENDVKSIWNDEDAKEDSTISPTNENGKMHTQNSFATVDAMNDSSDVLLLRRIPMSYSRKSVGNRSYFVWKQLGSLDRAGNCTSISSQNEELSRGKGVAQRYHAEEAEIVADLVGEQGHVFLDILTDRLDEGFDLNEYQSVYEQAPPEAFANKKSITVQDCIEKFCQMEQLEASEQWYCSRCKAHVRAWKQFHIYRSPPHLIVHLKRFQFSARTHRRQKIGVHIDFPLEGLDLTNQVLHWTDDEKPIYDCYAVSNHYGGLGGGHYTAYALNDGGVWCHYDDSRISSNVDVSEVVSQAAYVLYYRRRDIPVNVDFQMSMCTPESELRMPSMIENTPLIAIKLPHREPSEISSNAAMVDDDEVMEDTTENGSRSTSPASVDFAQQEYATSPFDEFNNNGDNDENDDDDGGTSIPSSMNKSSSSSLPLLQ